MDVLKFIFKTTVVLKKKTKTRATLMNHNEIATNHLFPMHSKLSTIYKTRISQSILQLV